MAKSTKNTQKKTPIRRGQRRRESPTAKFITDSEQAAIDAWMDSNEVTILEPFDPEAEELEEEASEEE